jgi:hypothetical protein
MDIECVKLRKWKALATHAADPLIYRGQCDLEPLRTSMERCAGRLALPEDMWPDLEDALIRDFKRAYHQYAVHVPADDANLEWVSLMQHYGAPTRLLDFTYSIYIAAYFALEKAESDCCVWSIDATWARMESERRLTAAGSKNTDEMRSKNDAKHEEPAWRNAKTETLTAWPVNPYRLNERLRIQRGVFLIQGAITAPFMTNLQAMSGCYDGLHVKKIVIPSKLRAIALKELYYMGISRTSLFPGLEGFSQSLAVWNPSYGPDFLNPT